MEVELQETLGEEAVGVELHRLALVVEVVGVELRHLALEEAVEVEL